MFIRDLYKRNLILGFSQFSLLPHAPNHFKTSLFFYHVQVKMPVTHSIFPTHAHSFSLSLFLFISFSYKTKQIMPNSPYRTNLSSLGVFQSQICIHNLTLSLSHTDSLSYTRTLHTHTHSIICQPHTHSQIISLTHITHTRTHCLR